MSIEIVRGTNDKPVSSGELAQILSGRTDLSGQLLIGYPIISTPEGRCIIDALLVCPARGIILFDLIQGTRTSDYGKRQDDLANKLEARLKTHSNLMQRRELRLPIHTLSFAPGVNNLHEHTKDEYLIANRDNLIQTLQAFNWPNQKETVYKHALSALQSISTIRKSRTKRKLTEVKSRGAKLKRLEESIALLDSMQSKAVIETVEGLQRIRGLAGSGKTIVLALKAAYLHAQHPEWRIAVTFNTRSLKGLFRRLINLFSIEQTGEEPNWENLRIVNAWGAPGGDERDGIYYEFCRAHDIEYLDFRSARQKFGSGEEFSEACKQAISLVQEDKQPYDERLYDVILVDEAQDLPEEFLRLCYRLLKSPCRLVYAYDELQNLSEQSLASPEEIFAKEAKRPLWAQSNSASNGGPNQDIILETCYRNSRPVLTTAHAIGFGVHREPRKQGEMGLVQMFDDPQLWEKIGYQCTEGELLEGSSVTLCRSEQTSPRFLEDHSPIEDLIKFREFDTEEEQTKWLTSQIKKNLQNDELQHSDIIVINPDPLTTRKQTGPIRSRLWDIGIASHLAGVDTDPDIFFQSKGQSVTFSGIYRAKGNEAGMVYIINAQDFYFAGNLASIRNRFFTAVTRSKAWVRVLGVGRGMKELIKEYEKLKDKNFELQFTYPTGEQRKQLRIIHRDTMGKERYTLQQQNRHLAAGLVRAIETGKLHREDLDEESVAKLKAFLAGKESKHANP